MAVRNTNTTRTPRQMVTALIDSIPSSETTPTTSNPLRDLSLEGRNIFLAVYALFEKELLPALDLLDRSLITRLIYTPGSNGGSNDSDTENEQLQPNYNSKICTSKLYLVRSGQQQPTNRNPHYGHSNYYEVRLDAWSCSCPAFAFAAFPATADNISPEAEPTLAPNEYQTDATTLNKEAQWLFGGVTRGSDMPVCKHLLACVLVEHCAVFAGFVEDKRVSIEEIAGWAAGWGD